MIYIRRIYGNWSYRHIQILDKIGYTKGLGYGSFDIEEGNEYYEILNNLGDSPEFSDTRINIRFSKSEILHSNNVMIRGLYPNMVYPARLSNDDDGYDYLRHAFGDICDSCNHIPKGEQIKPFTLAKEPRLAKKYLWGGFHGVSGYIFTDHNRYKIIHEKWGIGKREVLIGKNQKVSPNFVQLDIPIAESPLHFGSSFFGKASPTAIEKSGQEKPIPCSECAKPLYTNQTLDFFPSFHQDFDFDIVFTQEWFGWYRRLVISRRFAEWLVNNKYAKWDWQHFVPIRIFE